MPQAARPTKKAARLVWEPGGGILCQFLICVFRRDYWNFTRLFFTLAELKSTACMSC